MNENRALSAEVLCFRQHWIDGVLVDMEVRLDDTMWQCPSQIDLNGEKAYSDAEWGESALTDLGCLVIRVQMKSSFYRSYIFIKHCIIKQSHLGSSAIFIICLVSFSWEKAVTLYLLILSTLF